MSPVDNENQAPTRQQIVSTKECPVPIYHQIYLVLREQILEGAFKQGEPMPGEIQLSKMFNVSRVTIRATLEMLEREGLLSREKGRGTFPRPQMVSLPAEATFRGLIDNLIALGLRTKIKVIAFDLVRPEPEIAKWLELPLDAVVQKSVRLSWYKNVPFSYVTTYVRDEIGATYTRKEMEKCPLLILFERAGVKVESADQTVTARLADANVAHLLEIDVGSPLISMTRIVRDCDDRPIEVVRGLYRPDCYEFHITFSRTKGQTRTIWEPKR